MPSSADEANIQEETERQGTPKLPLSKKQLKKAKKAAAAAKLLNDQQDESSGLEEPTASEAEASCPETPPIFAQEIHDVEEIKVPALSAPIPAASPLRNVDTIDNIVLDFKNDRPNEPQGPASPFGSPPKDTSRPMSVPISPIGPSQPLSPPQSPSFKAATPRQPAFKVDSRVPPVMTSKLASLSDNTLPHMPQRHFSRIPETTIGLEGPTNEVVAGTDGYYCGFDSLEGTSQDLHDVAANVLLLGSEGALDICRYNRSRREVIGRLEGLRGSVLSAKLLPAAPGPDALASYRPLVACVVHGPVLDDQAQPSAALNSYQTTVEVYSLKLAKHVATLYRAAPQHLQYPVGHTQFVPPKPADTLSLSAEGSYTVVASGISGEVFVFTGNPSPSAVQAPFRCIGKFWTTTKNVRPLAATDGPQPDGQPESQLDRRLPLITLSKRWLALSPPSLTSSQKSAEGVATCAEDRPSPPGLSSYVSPPPPMLDCEVDAPAGNGLLNRVTKQATNEIRKGAQWVGEQGMGVIKSYWNRPTSTEGAANPVPAQKAAEEQAPAFPPTHAQARERPAVKIEPSLVSIIDLHKLADFDTGRIKTPLLPIATFSLTDGCSFLSLAPSGLALLTSNQVGDASTVWDLIRITDPNAAAKMSLNTPQLQHASGMVRRAFKFTRMSPSSIVDVRWTAGSNRVGILTSKGTLHVHEMPRHDPLAAALRSPASPAYLPRLDLPSPSTSPQDLSSGFMSNVRSGWQNMSGRINAIRSASDSGSGIISTTRQNLGQAGVAARYAGGRVMRNSYNTALEGAYSLRHSQDNKIRLRSLHHAVRPGCFRWMTGKDEGLISTVADGVMYVYAVKSNYHVQGKRTTIVLDASKKTSQAQTLPTITAIPLPPSALGRLDPDGPHASCARAGVHGFWTLHRDVTSQTPAPRSAQQDKETCPQYLPLHRLRQVSLHVYDETDTAALAALQGQDGGAWCFGDPLVATEKVTVAARKPDGDQRGFEGVLGEMDDFDSGGKRGI